MRPDYCLLTVPMVSFQVYIIGHVPPGFFEKKRGKPWYRPKFNKLYLDLIQKHHSVISGQFLGHHHTDSFRMFYSSEGEFTLCVGPLLIFLILLFHQQFVRILQMSRCHISILVQDIVIIRDDGCCLYRVSHQYDVS